jgi:hypothetical protein
MMDRQKFLYFIALIVILAALAFFPPFRYTYQPFGSSLVCIDRLTGRVWLLDVFNEWERIGWFPSQKRRN